MESRRRKIIIVVNRDAFFLSHRLPLARALSERGDEVVVVAEDTGFGFKIQQMGPRFMPLPIDRGGQNPIRELNTLRFLYRLYRQEKPDLVHHVTAKPIFYGTLAARLSGNIPTVNAIAGLGSSLHLDKRRHTFQQHIVRALYRTALSHPKSRSIFMNADHRKVFEDLRLLKDPASSVLIRGSGVEIDRFDVAKTSESLSVMFFSRLLRDKGIQEFVDAAHLLKLEFPHVRWIIVGATDPGNPSSVSEQDVESWKKGGFEIWGYREDVPQVLRSAHIVVLPTYGEGLPKALLEASAAGCAIVATDVPGCRDCIVNGVTGYLVPPRNAQALLNPLRHLLADENLRREMGRRGREHVGREFHVNRVVQSTLDLYDQLI